MTRKLTQDQINNLSKAIAREVEATELTDLFDPIKSAEITLGAVVTKDALLNDNIAELERVVPKDVDDSF